MTSTSPAARSTRVRAECHRFATPRWDPITISKSRPLSRLQLRADSLSEQLLGWPWAPGPSRTTRGSTTEKPLTLPCCSTCLETRGVSTSEAVVDTESVLQDQELMSVPLNSIPSLGGSFEAHSKWARCRASLLEGEFS